MRAVGAEVKKMASGRNRRPHHLPGAILGVRDSQSTDRIRTTPPPVHEVVLSVLHAGGSFREIVCGNLAPRFRCHALYHTKAR